MFVVMEVNPLNIFFVKSDSKGDRLLFRYPYTTENKNENTEKQCGRHNPYAINSTEDLLQNPQSQTSNICKGQLSGFTDEMLSTLFAVKAELCNRKFELKVNDVRFVGHPTLLPYRTNKDDTAAMILINIVFALQASASHSIVKCYYDLSKRLGKALRHEEKRCSYLTEEMKIMLAAHDEVSALDSENNSGENDDEEENSRHSVSSTTYGTESESDCAPKSAFHLILQRSSLARSMKAVFEELSSTGIVQVRINKWVLLSFCLPHKAHQIHNKGLIIEPETIDKCLQKLRPYHGILLMVDPNELLASIPLDGSPALLRLIKHYSPLKSLQTLAIEADLTLTQAFQLTGHLVYWAKATVIYPLCEGNVYVVAPGANIHINSPIVHDFAKEFPGLCLLQMLGEFSLPAPLWYVRRGAGGANLARCVAWLLRRRLLLQLHTYVQLNSPAWHCPRNPGTDLALTLTRGSHCVAWLLRRRLLLQLHTYVQLNSPAWHCPRNPDGNEYFCEKHDIYNQSCSVSFSSLNQMQLNVPEPVEARDNVNMFPDSDEDYPTENNLNQTDFSHTKPIVIESDHTKYDHFNEIDSANHSFDEGIDVVDGPVKTNGLNGNHDNKEKKKNQGNSVDSGISSNINGTSSIANGLNGTMEHINSVSEKSEDKLKALTTSITDLSLKENDTALNTSSDDDKFDLDISPRQKRASAIVNSDKKNGVSLNLKLQSEMSFQQPTVWNVPANCEAAETETETGINGGTGPGPGAEAETEAEALLLTFTAEERAALAAVPASKNPDDLLLLAQLHKKGYFRGEQHLEEIMFMENVSRSQLMQLLDKFKDVLITFETEDPAVAMLYPY
ncbi:GATOR complex protein NPRL3 [Galleria mellonella]|uniref:GATOR complex protein NPRL3 n=1 Tax=Galleria mellonella TaxID=7137 RepID=A0ABM3MDS9_GALME|nr:GATOR complex protein NPRL3 [Galleria mellonella]